MIWKRSKTFFWLLILVSVISHGLIIKLAGWPWLSGGWLGLFWALANFYFIAAVPTKKWWPIWLANLWWWFFWAYSLVNLANYRVFRNFLLISRQQLRGTNQELLTMMKEYYYLIPIELYISIIALLVISLIASWLNKRRLSRFARSNYSGYWRQLVGWLMINGLYFGLVILGQNYPPQRWLDKSLAAADWGIGGNLVRQVHLLLSNDYSSKLVAAITDEQRNNYGQDQIKQLKAIVNELGGKQTNQLSDSVQQLVLDKPHLVFIQLESISSWALQHNPTPMPFLQSLIDNNVSAERFLANSCHTINAEYSSLCGSLANSFEPIDYSHRHNNFVCLPQLLKKDGYANYVFHANLPDFWHRRTLYPKWGFDKLFFTPYFRQKDTDNYVLTELIKQLKIADQPTLNYFISFTSHGPHNQEQIDYNQQKNKLIIEPYAGELNHQVIEGSELNEQQIRDYLGFIKPVDDALRNFFDNLKREGLDQKTIVIIYGDHRFYNFSPINPDNFSKYNQVPFVMVIPGLERPIKINQTISHLDIAPTLWQLIYGSDKPIDQTFIGTSLLSANRPDGVISKCLGEVFYARDDLIIQGDVRNNLYSFLDQPTNWSDRQKNQTIDLLKKSVYLSDQLLYGNLLPVVD